MTARPHPQVSTGGEVGHVLKGHDDAEGAKVEKETITMWAGDREFKESHCLAGIPLTLTLLARWNRGTIGLPH